MREEKILIVEDEMIISATIEESLNKIGYDHIEIASNARKATELIDRNMYDVILMDINLGKGKDGIDVVQEIQKKKAVPVIYITGNSDNKTLSKAKTTLPGGFIVKPINETDLRVQVELLLYREKVKKIEREENEQMVHLHTKDLNMMSIVLSLDGNIMYITPHIYKITGKHTHEYANKKIASADFENGFYELLANTLNEVKQSSERSFYGTIYSPYIGKRVVNIQVTANGFFSYRFHFYDITDDLPQSEGRPESIPVAIASDNRDVLKLSATIAELINYSRITAEMNHIDAVRDYLKKETRGVLMLDVVLPGLAGLLEQQASNTPVKKILIASPGSELSVLQTIPPSQYDGCLSKTAGEASILQLFDALRNNQTYHDTTLKVD